MEEIRNVQIILVSAKKLDNIRKWGEMKVYAEVSLNGEKHTTKKTNVDSLGGVNPRWNYSVNYTISESVFTGEQQKPLKVEVKLYCARTRGRKFLGKVEISAQGLFKSRVEGVGELGFKVDGTRDGSLNIKFSFGEPYWFEEADQTQPSPSALKGAFKIGQMVLKYGICYFLSTDFDITPF